MGVEVKSNTARVNGIRLHYLEAGHGPAMVLLHGWPETSYAWRKVLPALAERYRVVAPDLRGMGHSDKPVGPYDIRTRLRRDVRELVRALGLERPYLVGHDWGGLAVRRYVLDWPGEASRLAILDIVPHEQILAGLTPDSARFAWHYFFNAFPDLPEALVQGREALFLRAFFWPKCHNPAVFVEECIAEYARAYAMPGALRGGFGYYRAMFEANRAIDRESEGRRIHEPMLVLWGNDGGMGGGGRDVLGMWRREADDVRGFGLDECGHYLAEEQPDMVIQQLLAFGEL